MSDLISRQAAIDALKTDASFVMFDDHGNYTADGLRILEVLTALPSAQPHDIARDIATIIENEKDMMVIERNAQQWIPCSERLPSEDGEYLVTRYAGYLPKKIIIDIAIYCRIRREWQKAYPVIAWMPLPEPYKGDRNETYRR